MFVCLQFPHHFTQMCLCSFLKPLYFHTFKQTMTFSSHRKTSLSSSWVCRSLYDPPIGPRSRLDKTTGIWTAERHQRVSTALLYVAPIRQKAIMVTLCTVDHLFIFIARRHNSKVSMQHKGFCACPGRSSVMLNISLCAANRKKAVLSYP